MMLSIIIDELYKLVGHDGSEILTADLPEPLNRRGFHIQEMTDLAWHFGVKIVTIERQPVSSRLSPHGQIFDFPIMQGDTRFQQYTMHCDGVMAGIGRSGIPHACAWFRRKLYDPNGLVYDDIENQFFKPTELYAFCN